MPTRTRRPSCVAPATATLLAAAAWAGAAFAGTLAEVPDFGSNPGALKMLAYVPDDLAADAPLVVVLHGCRQNARDYLKGSGWDEAADAGGFAVVLPEQQPGLGPWVPGGRNHPLRCFNFAELDQSVRDQGEALSIRQMVAHAVATLGADPNRVFVTGLSAGGGMTSAMLATYPDVFAAGAVIAGLPYRCGDATLTATVDCGVTTFPPRNPGPDRTPADWAARVRAAAPAGFAGPWPRVAVWQGLADGTVDPANARELVEQWTAVHGIDAVADDGGTVGPATREAFADAAGRPEVELYAIPGFGHATPIDPPCGRPGDFILDAGICSTAHIARFFGLAGRPPAVSIAATADGDAITVSGTATDPDGPVARVAVLLDGAAPQPAAPAGTGSWTHRFDGLSPGRFYLPVVVATDPDGRTAIAHAAPLALGAPPANAPPSVTVDAVSVDGSCVEVRGRASDDLGAVAGIEAVTVTVGPVSGPASLDAGTFAFQACRLPDGAQPVAAVASDALGVQATAAGPAATVATRVSARGTWMDHLTARRLRDYRAPCPNVGFGTCDAPFAAIHDREGAEPFDLFRAAASDAWYLDPTAIP